jgi:hypothetical protein
MTATASTNSEAKVAHVLADCPLKKKQAMPASKGSQINNSGNVIKVPTVNIFYTNN